MKNFEDKVAKVISKLTCDACSDGYIREIINIIYDHKI